MSYNEFATRLLTRMGYERLHLQIIILRTLGFECISFADIDIIQALDKMSQYEGGDEELQLELYLADTIKRALAADASVHFYDVEEMVKSGVMSKDIVPDILDRRRREIRDVCISSLNSEAKTYDMSNLWNTAYGFEILSALGHRTTVCNVEDLDTIMDLVESSGGSLRVANSPIKSVLKASSEFRVLFALLMGIPEEERHSKFDECQISHHTGYSVQAMTALENMLEFFVQDGTTGMFQSDDKQKPIFGALTVDKTRLVRLLHEGTPPSQGEEEYSFTVIEEQNEPTKLVFIGQESHYARECVYSITKNTRTRPYGNIAMRLELPYTFNVTKGRIMEIMGHAPQGSTMLLRSTPSGLLDISTYSTSMPPVYSETIDRSIPLMHESKLAQEPADVLGAAYSIACLKPMMSCFLEAPQIEVRLDNRKPMELTQRLGTHVLSAVIAPRVERGDHPRVVK